MYFGDGEHIIYVNGAMRSNDTPLGRLMNDLIEVGKLSLEEIDTCSGLPIEKIRELAGNKSA